MKRGVVGIKGVETNLYLCLSVDGAAYGSVRAFPTLKSRTSQDALLDLCSSNTSSNRHVNARLSSHGGSGLNGDT